MGDELTVSSGVVFDKDEARLQRCAVSDHAHRLCSCSLGDLYGGAELTPCQLHKWSNMIVP